MDGPADHPSPIGQRLTRREDARLLRGQGRFVADLAPPGCLHLAFARSPFGAGPITACDTAPALAVPGVRLVLTAADAAGLGQAGVNPLVAGARLVPLVPLAAGRVAAVGQAVAAVVADTAHAARDGAEAVALAVDEDGAEGGPVLSHARSRRPLGTDTAVSARVDHALVAPMPLEPRAVLADWDGARLTLHTGVQTPQRARDDLAAILRLPRDAVRVVAPDVGGAFGGKASLMPEDAVVALAALRLGRPVLWMASRGEEFLAATQGRGGRTEGSLHLQDGRAVALDAHIAMPLGHWMAYSALAPVNNAARILPGPYAVPGVHVAATAALTAGAGVNIYRGAGRPEAAMLLERLMDRAAAATGQDALAFRQAHLLPPAAEGPGSADLAGLCAAIAPAWAAARSARDAARAAGGTAGAGLALYAEPCGQGWETAEVRLEPGGRFTALTGSSAQGQGRETAAAQIVAAALGLTPAQVAVTQGDSDAVPEGIGALASRSTAIGGSALWRAAGRLADAARAAAAARLATTPDRVRLTPAGAVAPSGALPWSALAPLAATDRYTAAAEAWAAGAVVAQVAIDAETGAVSVMRLDWADDAGRVINPMLVEGQMTGGMAQGLGAALLERIVYRDGQLLTGSLMDYAIPRAADMPPLRLIPCHTPTAANPLNARGVGEAGTIGVPAAILNAVMDALPPGTPDLPLPLTPERVWRALNGLDPC